MEGPYIRIEETGDVIPLAEAVTTIGRGSGVDVRLADPSVSRLHAGQFRSQFAATLDHFDALVLSHEIGVRKPDPRVYTHCQTLANSLTG